jgi:hypothetical protein
MGMKPSWTIFGELLNSAAAPPLVAIVSHRLRTVGRRCDLNAGVNSTTQNLIVPSQINKQETQCLPSHVRGLVALSAEC